MTFDEWLLAITPPTDPANRGKTDHDAVQFLRSVFEARGAISYQEAKDIYVAEVVRMARDGIDIVRLDVERLTGTWDPATRIEADEDGIMVWTSTEGHGLMGSINSRKALVEVAEHLEDMEMAGVDENWLKCPTHDMALHAGLRGQRAAWWCPVDGHAAADIGELGLRGPSSD